MMHEEKNFEITEENARKLATFLVEENITGITFSGIKNFASNSKYLAEVLCSNTTLKQVIFISCFNGTQPTHLAFLEKIVRDNQQITTLSIKIKDLSDDAYLSFLETLKNNLILESITILRPDRISDTLQDEADKITKRNKKLKGVFKQNADKIDFSDNDLSGDVFGFVVSKIRNVTAITQIVFDKCGITDKEFIELADYIQNSNHLTELQLTNNKLSDESISLLKKILESHPSLSNISLKGNAFSPEGEADIASFIRLNKAVKLEAEKIDFSLIKLSDDILNELINKLSRAVKLTQLKFSGCKLTNKGLSQLIDYVRNNKLITTLKLDYNKLNDESIPLLENLIKSDFSLVNIDLYGNDFSEEGKKEITSFVAAVTHLTEFSLEIGSKKTFQEHIDNYIKRNKQLNDLKAKLKPYTDNINLDYLFLGQAGCQCLVSLLQAYNNIYNLTLTNCTLTIGGFACLAEFLKSNKSLESLVFKGTDLDDVAMELLAIGLQQNSTITNLSFVNNKIGNRGAKALADVLKNRNTRLAVLSLSNSYDYAYRQYGFEYRNTISQEGMVYFAQALKDNRTLYKLSLDHNPIPGAALTGLAEALKTNPILTHLSLRNTQIDEQGVAQFILALDPSQNKALKGQAKKNAAANNSLSNVCFSIVVSKEKKAKNKWDQPEQVREEKVFDKVSAVAVKSKISVEVFKNRNLNVAREIISATERGDLNKLKELIKISSLYVTKEDDSSTLLHIAIQFGHTSIVKYLLEQGINRRLRNNNGISPIGLAKQLGKQDMIDLLTQITEVNIYELTGQAIKAPNLTSPTAQKRKQDPQGMSQTSQAFTDVSVNKPKKIKIEPPDQASTPPTDIMSATKTDSPANSMIFKTKSVSYGDLSELALFDAIATGQIYQLQVMVNKMGTLNYRDLEGNTCLHIAVLNNQLKAAEILIAAKIEVNAVNAEGFTPLYLLIDRIVQYSSNEQALLIQYQLAQLLIRAGAKPDIEVKDLNRNKMTALTKAVALEQYILMKIILNARSININHLDEQNWNALNWAIERRNKKILARLLIDCCWQDSAIQNAIDHVLLLQNDERGKVDTILLEMKNLLEKRQNLKVPESQSGMHWIKKFSVVFGSHKPQKQIIINSEKEHAYLAMQNEFTRKRIFDPEAMDEEGGNNDFPGNPATASITFITSAGSFQAGQVLKRKRLIIPLNLIDNFHISGDEADSSTTPIEEKERIKHRSSLAPADFFAQQRDKYLPLTPDDIESKFQAEIQNQDPGFKQLFHHGEQSLLDYLEQPATIQQIVQALKQHQKFVYGCKIYGLILTIYSPRYACENCEAGILGEQNAKSPFLIKLKSELEIIGCVLPKFSPLRMLTQISSHMNFHKEAVSEQEHEELYVDLRACNNTLILARDINAFEPKITQFHSSKFKL